MKTKQRATWAAVAVLAIVFVGHCVLRSGYTEEDAFISFQYARNLAWGEGLVFNPGERVEGYTNFLWTVLLGLPQAFGWDVLLFAKVLGTLCGLAALLLLLVDRLRGEGVPLWLGLAAGLVVALDPGVALWSVGGLETALYMLLVTGAVLCLTVDPWEGRRALVTGVLFGLAALTRPEAVLLVVVGLVLRLVRGRGAAGVRPVLLAAGGVLLLVGPHLVWRLVYYGYPLPNTFYAKVGASGAQVLRGWRYVRDWSAGMFYLPFVGLALPLVWRGAGWRLRSRALLCLAHLAGVVVVGGDWMRAYRFVVPILPLLMLVLYECLVAVGGWVSRLVRLPRPVVVGVLFALPVAAMGVQLQQDLVDWEVYSPTEEAMREMTLLGRWLKRHALPGMTMATGVLGRVTYYSELRVLDTLGLVDAHIAHSKGSVLGSGAAGHEKRDMDYVFSRRPELVIGMDQLVMMAPPRGRVSRAERRRQAEEAARRRAAEITAFNRSARLRREYFRILGPWPGARMAIFVRRDLLHWVLGVGAELVQGAPRLETWRGERRELEMQRLQPDRLSGYSPGG
jgi:hypothetical protein